MTDNGKACYISTFKLKWNVYGTISFLCFAVHFSAIYGIRAEVADNRLETFYSDKTEALLQNGGFEYNRGDAYSLPEGWQGKNTFSFIYTAPEAGYKKGEAYVEGHQGFRIATKDANAGIEQIMVNLRPATTYTVSWSWNVSSGKAKAVTVGAAKNIYKTSTLAAFGETSARFTTDILGSYVTLSLLGEVPGTIVIYDDVRITEEMEPILLDNGGFEEVYGGAEILPYGWSMVGNFNFLYTAAAAGNVHGVGYTEGSQGFRITAEKKDSGICQVLAGLKPLTTYTVTWDWNVSSGKAKAVTVGAAKNIYKTSTLAAFGETSARFTTDILGSYVTLSLLGEIPGTIVIYDDVRITEEMEPILLDNGGFEEVYGGAETLPYGWSMVGSFDFLYTAAAAGNVRGMGYTEGSQGFRITAKKKDSGICQVLAGLKPLTTYTVTWDWNVSLGKGKVMTKGAAADILNTSTTPSFVTSTAYFTTDNIGSSVTLLLLGETPGTIVVYDRVSIYK